MPAGRIYKKRRGRYQTRKRVLKRRAYKRKNRKAVARAIAPIAEGRKQSWGGTELTTLLPSDTPELTDNTWIVNIPNAWEQYARENALETQPNQLTDRGFTGSTLFCRYINQHMQINFEKITHIATPVQLRVCYGYAKIPYATQFQAVGTTDRNANGVVVGYNPESFIESQLRLQYADLLPTNDPKKFKMFHNKVYYIKGSSIPGMNTKDSAGFGPRNLRREMNFKPSWKPQKKYHMMPCTRVVGSGATGLKPDDFFPATPGANTTFWTPSNTKQELWYPFFAFQFINKDDFGYNETGDPDTNAYPQYVQKNTSYFYDL